MMVVWWLSSPEYMIATLLPYMSMCLDTVIWHAARGGGWKGGGVPSR
jgi:hypothetical protein